MGKTITGTYSTILVLSAGESTDVTIASEARLKAGLSLSPAVTAMATNYGTITGTGSYSGISLGEGYVTNFSLGRITGQIGIDVSRGAGTVDNAATIDGTSASGGAGIYLQDGGSVTNQVDGTIGGNDGIAIAGAAGTVVNNGHIRGTSGIGIALFDGGAVRNHSDGTITGTIGIYAGDATAYVQNAGLISASLGIYLSIAAGSVTNSGTIEGGDTSGGIGVDLQGGGTVTNQSGATISGYIGIEITGAAGTVFADGSISGTKDAISLASGFTNLLVLYPDATITGVVDGGNPVGGAGDSTLEIVSSNATSTLSGIGTDIIGFDHIVVDSHVSIKLTGTIASGYSLFDDGTVTNTSTVGVAVTLGSGAVLSNASTGEIFGSRILGPSLQAATVINAGLITVAADRAIYMRGDDSLVINEAGGTIASQQGVYIYGQAYATDGSTLINDGFISAASGTHDHFVGVSLTGESQLTNEADGTIFGYSAIYNRFGRATVVNAGTLDGVVNAVSFVGGYDSLLVDDPGAVFIGFANGGLGNDARYSTLELASGSTRGTLSGLGDKFTHFPNITIDSGATWTLASSTINGSYTLLDNGTLINAGTLAWKVTLGPGAVLTNVAAAEISASQGIGVKATGKVTVFNAGTIEGGSYSLKFFPGYDDRLVLFQGYVFSAQVSGGNAIGSADDTTLELASGSSAADLSGFGSKFIDFANVTVDANAVWTLSTDIGVDYTLTDSGTLTNTDSLLTTVTLESGALLSNAATGLISVSGKPAVYGPKLSGSVTVENAGRIVGDTAVALYSGGTITNDAGGTISGTVAAYVYGAAQVVNDGIISGATGSSGNYGVLIRGSVASVAQVTNQAAGTISGKIGVGVTHGVGTLENAGSISGSSYAVLMHAGYANRVVFDPEGSFSGEVDGGNALGSATESTLELASGSTTGTLSGLGSQFVDFAQVTVDSGAKWVFESGAVGADQTLTNAGTLFNVTLGSGGILTNLSTGEVTASSGDAVLGLGPATVINKGSIAASTDAVRFESGVASRLVLYPGASISGTADGGNALGSATYSTLELASSSSSGTVSGLGTQFTDFARITLDANATWAIAGDNTLGAGGTLTDSGNLKLTGSLVNDGAITAGRSLSLAVGSIFTNAAGGTLTDSGDTALYDDGASVLTNAGLVSAVTTGISLVTDTAVTNQDTGTITAGSTGIYVKYDQGTVINAGRISVTSSTGAGVLLARGGVVTNQSGATISGGAVGISETYHYDSEVVNAGSIGGTSLGVLIHGGFITNQAGGTITGSLGVYSYSASTLVNAGDIAGGEGNYGILIRGDGASTGVVTNQSGGTISGLVGVGIKHGAATLINDGAISGSSEAVLFHAGYTNRVVFDPGASFVNTVDGGNTVGSASVSTLELASGTSGGTLSSLGTQFIDFAAITLDADASWTLTGTNSLASETTLTNAGTLVVSDASLTDSGLVINDGSIVLDPSTVTVASLTGTGVVSIGAGSTLIAQGTVASGETITFATGDGGQLDLVPADFDGEIAHFLSGDTIVLTGITNATAATITSGNTLEVTLADSTTPIDLTLSSDLDYNDVAFTVGVDSTTGYDTITNDLACFAEGSRLDTPIGPVAVETLRPGDRVLTSAGPARAIKWIGWRRLDLRRHPDPAAVQPVRVLADAFASGIPRRDVRLSPDHALLIDGVLIPVRQLINGTTIARELGCFAVAYFHVELETHDVLLVEGLAAESYLDTGNRGAFQNADEPLILHPDMATTAQRQRQTRAIAPLATDAATVEPIWRRLADRAMALGHRPPPMPTTTEAALRIVARDRVFWPVSVGGGKHVFVLPPGSDAARLVSRAAPPSDSRPWLDDRRSLGVMLQRICLRNGAAMAEVALDDPRLADGWWDVERDGARLWRWTDGDAALPLAAWIAAKGPVVVEVFVGGSMDYPAAQDNDPSLRADPAAKQSRATA